MRRIRLGRKFVAVLIYDAISYLLSKSACDRPLSQVDLDAADDRSRIYRGHPVVPASNVGSALRTLDRRPAVILPTRFQDVVVRPTFFPGHDG